MCTYSIFIQTRSTCGEVFLNCTWNNVRDFDCCKHFILTETELGICYTLTMENESLVCIYVNFIILKFCNFNVWIYLYRQNSDDFIDMYSNRETGPSNLHITLSSPSQVIAIYNMST